MGCPGRGEKRREEGGLSLAVDRKASIAHRHRILFRYCENHRTPKSEEKWPRHRPSFRDSHVAEATGEFSGKNFFPPLLLTSSPTIRSITPVMITLHRPGEEERCRLGGNFLLFFLFFESKRNRTGKSNLI